MTKRVCTENGQPSYTIEFTYDNAGKCIQEEITYPDETKDFYTKEYDVNGNVKKVAYTYADGTVERVEYQYVFTYVTVDVPTWTMNQIEGLFDII